MEGRDWKVFKIGRRKRLKSGKDWKEDDIGIRKRLEEGRERMVILTVEGGYVKKE